MNDKGKLIIVSAPSGAGKTTIVHHLLRLDLNLEFSISACSREKRKGETEGVDYYFLPVKVFREKIARGEFAEWEEVYPGQYYGTLRSEIERIWTKRKHVIFDVDVKGGVNLKKKFGAKALAIFIMPPSTGELRKRLEKRSSDTPESIHRRIRRAQEEISWAGQFDTIIINDSLDIALKETADVVADFLNT